MIKAVKSSLATTLALLTLSTGTSRALNKEAVKKCILGVSAGIGISAVVTLGVAKFLGRDGKNESGDENNSHKRTSTNPTTNPDSNQIRAYSTVPLVGIQNGSAQCFVNSVLQVLFSCPEFVDYLKSVENESLVDESSRSWLCGCTQKHVDVLISNLKSILAKMENSNGKAIDVYDEVNEIREYFAEGRNKSGDAAGLFRKIAGLLCDCVVFSKYPLKTSSVRMQNPEFWCLRSTEIAEDRYFDNYLKNLKSNNEIPTTGAAVTRLEAVVNTVSPDYNDKNMFLCFNHSQSPAGHMKILAETLTVNSRTYQLIACVCSNSGHAISCIRAQGGSYSVVNDDKVSKGFCIGTESFNRKLHSYGPVIAFYRQVDDQCT